jgi:integrase
LLTTKSDREKNMSRAEPQRVRLTKRTVDSLKPPRSGRFIVWDDRLKGFGVRVSCTGKKGFLVQGRVGRQQYLVAIGDHGPWTVEQARQRAEEIIHGADEGRNPAREKHVAREAITVAELCDIYMEAARAGLVMTRFKRPKRPSTLAIDEGRIERHIKPVIGSIPARDLRRADVQHMADAIAQSKTAGVFKGKPRGRAVVTGGTGTAARVVELLGGVWSWASLRDLVPEGTNPTKGVQRVRGEAKERVLTVEELERLGRTVGNEPAGSALRLIALTGLRREEAESLKWSEVDFAASCLRLAETKTGRSVRPIGAPVLDLLRDLPRIKDCPWVFPNRDCTGPADLKERMAEIFARAGLPGRDKKSQALRRTFGSIAADEGYGDAAIKELLGHARRGVTEQYYVRRSDPVIVAMANRVAARVDAAMKGASGGDDKIVPFRPQRT